MSIDKELEKKLLGKGAVPLRTRKQLIAEDNKSEKERSQRHFSTCAGFYYEIAGEIMSSTDKIGPEKVGKYFRQRAVLFQAAGLINFHEEALKIIESFEKHKSFMNKLVPEQPKAKEQNSSERYQDDVESFIKKINQYILSGKRYPDDVMKAMEKLRAYMAFNEFDAKEIRRLINDEMKRAGIDFSI